MKIAKMPDGSPEIFFTIQGEGRNVGLASIFIRASLCNLYCHWCDTDYTWNWEDTDFEHESGRKYDRSESILSLSEEDIVAVTDQFECRNFVFTGGEPLIQEKNWVRLMQLLSAPDSHFEIETNGTLLPGADFLSQINQVNISPKLNNSGVPEKSRYQPDVLAALGREPKADFKFVVSNDLDLAEVEAIVTKARIPAERIFLMAQASSISELENLQEWVANSARDRGYRYSDRLHIRLFGAKRGV